MFGGAVWGQAAPASTPILPIRPRLDTVYSAAEQTDPMPELEQLCEGIGPRLTGTIAAQRAERQVLAHMREIGLQQVLVEVGDYEDLDPSSGDIRFEMFHEFARMDRAEHTHPDLPRDHRAHLNDREMRDNNPALRLAGSRKTVITWAEPSSGW